MIGVCGHYTQMAWADAKYFNCGATLSQEKHHVFSMVRNHIHHGLCSGCQSLHWNWCDIYLTNCNEYN